MKKSKIIISVILSLIVVVLFLIYYLAFTTSGSTLIAKLFLSSYFQAKGVDINESEGSISEVLILENLEIDYLKFLPEGSVVRIQKLELDLNFLNSEGPTIKVSNGRLQLPNSELILFHGELEKNILNFNVYSKGIYIQELAELISKENVDNKVSGLIENIDLYLKGTLEAAIISGELQISELLRNEFSLSDCNVFLNLKLQDIKKEPKTSGTISCFNGKVSGPKTAVVNLEESKIFLSGNIKEPSFDIKGSSNVEGVKIKIKLKGTINKPDLKLSSEPPLPEGRLLAMLATNKSWKGIEGSMDKGYLSADLAKDFIDYFVFSGSGSKIANQLGISDISVTFENGKKGVKIKKAVSEKLDASYGVEQTQKLDQPPSSTQTIGGDYKITDSISLGVEKELKQETSSEDIQDEQEKANDKVLLKFKKEF